MNSLRNLEIPASLYTCRLIYKPKFSNMAQLLTKNLIDELQAIPTFNGLPEDELQWLIEHSLIRELEEGEYLFKKGDSADHMWVILQGKVQLLFEQAGQLLPLNSIHKGEISGLLPYSQLKIAVGSGMATEKSTILTFHRKEFPGLEKVSPEMVRRLVMVMTSRIREYTKSQEQREKLLSLGKLSAGLAHELNNPAAAIVRTSAELRKSLAKIPKKVQKLAAHQLSPEQLDKVTALIKEKSLQTPPKLSSLQRSEREDELLGWLDEREVEDGFCLAEVFVKTGLSVQDMEAIAAQVPVSTLSDVFDWLGVSLNCDQLLQEIEESSSRISIIVDSVKTYTHMDQASDRQWVDLHTGLESTLAMLNHKLKSKNIEVIRQYQEKLPPVRGIVNELNQLWTNLIDNAIDAMKEGGKLQLATSKEGSFMLVKIIDNGVGIAPEILSKIFDPFFTTKAIGQGTGLGLDIVNRIVMNHSATIKVESVAGRTQFLVSFPMETE